MLLALKFKDNPTHIFKRVTFLSKMLRLDFHIIGLSCLDKVSDIFRTILECLPLTETEAISK